MHRLSFENLATVFRDATDPILIEDLEGRVLAANREAVRVYGWSEEELRGQPIKQIVPAERHAQADELLRRCRAGEEVRDVEGLRWTKEGRRIPSLITLSLLADPEGQPIGIASFVKDISALKRAQAELESQVAARTAELSAANQRLERELRLAEERAEAEAREGDLVLRGESIALQALLQGIELHAKHEGPLLLTGPAQAGQPMVARAVHRASACASGPFLQVECGHLDPEDTLAERLELAAGGTLFLEGIDALVPRRRAELQRLLQVPALPARLITATTLGFAALVGERGLEPDLVSQLLRLQLRVPGLVERGDDLVPLAEAYLELRARSAGESVARLSEGSRELLRGYPWPGGFRELWGVLDRAVSLAKGSGQLDLGPFLEQGGGPHVAGYTLVRCLGRGGMGEVWLAKHDLLVRPAAVKLIVPEVRTDPARLASHEARFRREARATARLTSPHTVQIYDFGVSAEGAFYYVMEFLEGYDLFQLVQLEGALPAGRAVHLLTQATYSLEEAHDQGLIHRDVKPSNLFAAQVGPQRDFVKVLDFGLVRLTLEGEESTRQLTRSGFAVGTPATMAPELLGEGEASPQSDLYALGCVAYWLLSGRNAFEGKTPMSVLKQHLNAEPQPLAPPSGAVPAALDQLVRACLAKDPAARPSSCAELRERLAGLSLEPWTDAAARAWWRARGPASPAGGGSPRAFTTRTELELPPPSPGVASPGSAGAPRTRVMPPGPPSALRPRDRAPLGVDSQDETVPPPPAASD